MMDVTPVLIVLLYLGSAGLFFSVPMLLSGTFALSDTPEALAEENQLRSVCWPVGYFLLILSGVEVFLPALEWWKAWLIASLVVAVWHLPGEVPLERF